MWPTYATASTGLALIISGGLFLMGGLLQINPVWLYGPYDVFTITSGAQADFYVLWLQGALRLMPPWEIRAFGYTIANPFFPGILLPGLMFGSLLLWPWLEALRTRDWRNHHLLDFPSDRPVRTAIGVGVFTFVVQLLVAGADDVIAVEAGWNIATFRVVERFLLLVLPVVTGLIAYKIARDLSLRNRREAPKELVATVHASTPDGQRADPSPASRRMLGTGMLLALANAVAQRLRNHR